MKLRCLLSVLALVPLFSIVAAGQEARAPFDPADWFDVRARNLTHDQVTLLILAGVDVRSVRGTDAVLYVTHERLAELRGMGYDLTPLPRAGANGNRVGYHTHASMTADLQAIAAAHPTICQLIDIGPSHQGRELWFMKISDNVAVEEDEPEFKYISSMHGDEVVGIELCIELIDLLTSQYGTDPQITRLVDEVEIWIMPMMNPDGRMAGSRYNAQGFDLNREFPDRVQDPNNTTTGRPTEVRRIMDWGFAHSPVLSGNFHGGALVVNYPYDSDPNPFASYSATPDDDLIIQQSLAYSTLNGPMYNNPWFPQGITNGIAWYLIYGGMQDWNYVWQGCNDVTIELDNDAWPPYSRIAGLWNDNRDSMLAYMEECLKGIRGVVTDITDGSPVGATVRLFGRNHDVYGDPDVGDYHRMILPGTYRLRFTATGYQPRIIDGIVVGAGDATRLDVALVPDGFTPPAPDLKIDGQDGPLTVPASQPISVTVALEDGDLTGVAHDWWVRADNGTNTFYWTFPANWHTAETRCYAGGLRDLPAIPIVNGLLPVGTWTFTFAVDPLDGAYQGQYADSVVITSY